MRITVNDNAGKEHALETNEVKRMVLKDGGTTVFMATGPILQLNAEAWAKIHDGMENSSRH